MSDQKKLPTRNGYGDALMELGQSNANVVVLTADLAESLRVQTFQEKYPDRFFDVGVAEQNMMGIAAGLALTGKIPFVSSYAVFSPGRSWDQFRVSVCYSQANVKVAGGHTGLSVGPDGATHQALEDLAITRCLPNLTILVPVDAEEARKATLAAASHQGPVYIRLSREPTDSLTTTATPFEIGKAYVMRPGKDLTFIVCGTLMQEALRAADQLATQGISAEVINNHTLKPLDEKTLLTSLQKTGAAVTIEEHQLMGGMGGAVAEMLAQNLPVPLEMIGMHDHFGESGTPSELLEKYGMTAPSIVNAAIQVLARKNS